jgi:hypothetical protein
LNKEPKCAGGFETRPYPFYRAVLYPLRTPDDLRAWFIRLCRGVRLDAQVTPDGVIALPVVQRTTHHAGGFYQPRPYSLARRAGVTHGRQAAMAPGEENDK